MRTVFVVSWFNEANYEFVAAYVNGAEARRTAKVLQKVTPGKQFRVEQVEIEDAPE